MPAIRPRRATRTLSGAGLLCASTTAALFTATLSTAALADTATLAPTPTLASTLVSPQHAGHGNPDASDAGLQTRTIASLSAADIAELQRGGDWGLALPAELNGMPGPAQVLELADQLGLSPAQRARIQQIHDEMQLEAIAAGDRLIEAERALSDAFRAHTITDEDLRYLIARSEDARAALRYIHLSRRLQIAPLLRAEQIARYDQLRGYAPAPGTPDSCAHPPAGHDPAQWRRDNNCGG